MRIDTHSSVFAFFVIFLYCDCPCYLLLKIRLFFASLREIFLSEPGMDQDRPNTNPRYPSPFVQQLLKLKVWFADRFHIRERQLMLLLGAVIGLLGALASECFRRATDVVHFLATGSDMEIISSFAQLPLWQKLAVPVAGGFFGGLTLWLGDRVSL